MHYIFKPLYSYSIKGVTYIFNKIQYIFIYIVYKWSLFLQYI